MDQQSLVCKAHTFQYLGMLLVGIIIGAGASFTYSGFSSKNAYQAGFEDAKKRVTESSFGAMFQANSDIRSLSGEVLAVDGTKIMIRSFSSDPFADPSLNERVVVISESTGVFKQTQKDPKAIQEEMAAFMKSTAGGALGEQVVNPPMPFVRTPVKTDVISVGSRITVTASENIKSLKEFTAKEIDIQ